MGKNKNKTYNVFIVKICRERILLKNMRNILMIVIKMFQGILIGVGAVLPGLSGGVLCVAFGIYKTVMELIANPFKNLKTHIISLAPYIIGGAIGFLGIANILSVFLEKYPAPSVCFFVGLIVGLLPSLIREAREKGDNRNSVFAAVISMEITFIILISLKILSIKLTPNFMWYIFCGACLGLSIIAPGMSFSTLLMPIGLYEPFIAGIGNIDLNVTKIALSRLGVDDMGLDEVDIALLKAIIYKFNGGPVGVEALSASIGEEVSTIEDVYEPYLLQQGFLKRTNRGRVVTDKAYEHLNIERKM